MKTRTAVLLAAVVVTLSAALASAQEQHLYTLTDADAARINARRPSDWLPIVKAGDVFAIHDGLVIIPTIAPAAGGPTYVAVEDLEPLK
jgi:hypothetical protein